MRNQKAVTLISLIITIAVMIILTFTITVNIEPYKNQKRRTNFETDMTRLKEEVSQYFARVKTIPIINRYTNTTMLDGIRNINDNDEYYVIDISKLEVKLNYGADYYNIINKSETEEITDLLDVYIINKQSHTVYYPKGIEYNGVIHYRLPEVFSEVNKRIKVTYNVDVNDIKTQEYIKGESVLNPNFTPQKQGWTFVGWKEDTIANGNVLTSKVMEKNEITLYAVYKKEIPIVYNANGATSGSMGTQNIMIYYNAAKNEGKTSFTLTKNTFARTGYNFEGWSTAAGGSKVYSDEQKVIDLTITNQQNINLYTIWNPIVYRVTYNISKGTIPSGVIREFTIETPTFNLPTPSGTNYVFKGWYGNSSFSGSQVTQIPKGSVGDKVVYAKEHQHTGQPGQSSSNGCYTKQERYGGKCGGHVSISYTWDVNCGRCGTYLGRTGDPNGLIGACSNRVCAKDRVSPYNQQEHRETSYCSSQGCSAWVWQYRYLLGCGW